MTNGYFIVTLRHGWDPRDPKVTLTVSEYRPAEHREVELRSVTFRVAANAKKAAAGMLKANPGHYAFRERFEIVGAGGEIRTVSIPA